MNVDNLELTMDEIYEMVTGVSKEIRSSGVKRFAYQRNYCPKCGAKMDEEEILEKQELTKEAETEDEE